MNLKIEMELDDSAFDEGNFKNEILRILDKIKNKIPDNKEETEFKIFDINGNSIGKVIMCEEAVEDTEPCYLRVSVDVRHLEDAWINGEEDINGKLPFLSEDKTLWEPLIDIKKGQIVDWGGIYADIHYKVCDGGIYQILNKNKVVIKELIGYVPKTMCPSGEGYGDYIIMSVDEAGNIDNFKFNLKDFEEEL